jgi:pentatricopeptide repeat protein
MNLDKYTFILVIKACARLESDVFLGNNLIEMYAKCGSLEDAFTLFNNIPS